MDILTELLKSIGEFMRFFAPGFIFLECMNFAGSRRREERIEYLVISCIALSFIISTISDFTAYTPPIWLPWPSSQAWAILLSTVLGLLSGKLSKTLWMNRLVNYIFHRDFRNNLFVALRDEMEDNNCSLSVRLRRKGDSNIYVGQVEKILNPIEDPVLILYGYSYYEAQGKKTGKKQESGEFNQAIPYSDVEIFEYTIIRKEPAAPDSVHSPC